MLNHKQCVLIQNFKSKYVSNQNNVILDTEIHLLTEYGLRKSVTAVTDVNSMTKRT